ncbi:MAG: GTP cyclohydrolase [Lutibacter sp.]
MIIIKELVQKQELKAFVKFPFKLYKNNKYWVPPIIKDELASFDKSKNPVFKHANARFFVAVKEGEIVGRIAAITNSFEINEQQIKKMRFGWFDFIDDYEVSKLLINKVQEIGVLSNLDFMEGPVGFSNLDKVGVLTEGFEELGTMITWYNHPYYANHYEKLGFKPEKVYLENKFSFENLPAETFLKASGLIKKRYHLKPINFSSTKDLMPYVDEMFDLFNKSYAKLSSFVPISEEQKAYFKKKYISFINPQFIKFVLDENNKIIAFGITMPSFSKALQKAKGKLLPFGIFHLLKAKRNIDDIIFYLIGVDPKYQNKGVTAVIFEEFYKTFKSFKIKNCIRTPELETNTAIASIWKHFNTVVYKKRCTYRKSL